MARTKGTYNLSANIETNAAAPLDARNRVATKADLTAAGSFPYPWVGMETYVTAENKKYRLVGNDPTVLSNWEEVGAGGGSYTLPMASASTLGGIKIGDNLSIDSETGVLSAVMPNVDLSNMIGNGDIYSTDEKLIGQWKDGKPLYQKSYTGLATFGIANEWTSIPSIVISNVSQIVKGFGVRSSDGAVINIANFRVNGSALQYFITQSYDSVDTVVIQYTKTTDTAQAIGNANDYSTTEKIVGTWIDGKAIYQRTLTGLNASLNTSDWNTLCNIPNISYVIDAIGYYNNSGTGLINKVILTEIEPYNDGTVKAQVVKPRTINELTIRYTKSS